MTKWEPEKGNYAGGALNILNAFENGQLAYPYVTLALAGEEANATRAGDMRAKEAIHGIVEIISDAVHRAGLKKRGEGFKDVPIPPEVIQAVVNNPKYQEYKAKLQASTVREAMKAPLQRMVA